MPRSTTGTAWVYPVNADGSVHAHAFRATFWSDGSFRRANGVECIFDPEKSVFFTSDMVQNVAAHNHIRMDGDVCSAARLGSSNHIWKSGMTLAALKAHKHLGKTMPSPEKIVSYFASMERMDIELD